MGKQTILFLGALVVSLFCQTALARDYWLIDEFLKIRPEQELIGRQFNRLVQDPAVPISQAPAKPVNIAIIYPDLTQSDYWRRSVSSFQSRLEELNIPYRITPYYTDPTAELRRQEQLILEAIEQDVDYLVFTLYSGRHRRMLEHIIAKGRPKLILQNITTPLKAWRDSQPFLYVGFDHAIGTRMLADWFMRQEIANQDYAMVYWAKGYISQMRGDTFIDILRQNGNFRLVDSYYTRTTRGSAYTAAANIMLHNPDLGFIYSCSTDVAFGVSDVIREKGKSGQILLNGWGGGEAELRAIADGRLDVTVMRMNDDNGVAMAEAIKLDLEGHADKVPVVYSGEFSLISRDTPAEKIETLKRRAFRYSGTQQQGH